MSLELISRLQRELAITGSALYETVLAISERVNRKVQIMRLHWHASTLLQRNDRICNELGREIADCMVRRSPGRSFSDIETSRVDQAVARATFQAQDLKRSLVQLDAQIRQLKLESIHEDLLRLHQDLSVRSAGIERVVVTRSSSSIGKRLDDVPRSSSVHIATVLRGPFLLAPVGDLVFRTDDIVVLLGAQAELDQLTLWFAGPRSAKQTATKSA
ncbi:MAG: TrkA C-terminal domain-containing protein [Nitrospira sp.]